MERRGVIERALGLCGRDLPLESTEGFDLGLFIIQFLEEASASQSLETRLCLAWLLVFGSYPKLQEWELLSHHFKVLGAPQAIEWLIKTPQFKELIRTNPKIKLFAPAKNAVFFDASHTIGYPFNTGIQRVVRKLAESLQLNDQVVFFRFDPKTNQPRILTQGETRQLLHFHLVQADHSSFLESCKDFLGLGFSFLRNVLAATVSQIRDETRYSSKGTSIRLIKAAFSKWEQLRESAWVKWFYRRSWGKTHEIETLVLVNSLVLLPEIVTEAKRVDSYLMLRRSGSVGKISAVIYDLIPLIYPELCVVVKPFVDYALLFRVIDHGLCISKSVEEDLRAFLRLVPREVPKPMQLSTVYLAGDFKASDAAGLKSDQVENELLCVGTFEPRKNHVSLLRAGYILHKKGLRFKINFVGNPGWRANQFFSELAVLDPSGEFTCIKKSVSDDELNVLYSRARLSVFVSLSEGFGLPILEAISRGTPVITSNRGCMKELAEICGGVVTVDPIDVDAIAGLVEQLLFDDLKYQELKRAVRVGYDQTWASYARVLLNSLSASPGLETRIDNAIVKTVALE